MSASLGMGYSYEYTEAEVNRRIDRISPGNYALGELSEDGKMFTPRYVGRSDSNLNQEVRSYLSEKPYPQFKFKYARTVGEAFETECNNFHDFRKVIENQNHPDKPDGTALVCPRCGV